MEQDAFRLLQEFPAKGDWGEILKKTMEVLDKSANKGKIITRKDLQSTIESYFPSEKQVPSVDSTVGRVFHPFAKDVEADIRIVSDPTEELGTAGDIKDFLQYFQDRFRSLRQILKQRIDVHDAISIADAQRASSNREMKIIAMVTEKKERKRSIMLQVEDLENAASLIVPPTIEQAVFERFRQIILDEVLCFHVVKGQDGAFITKNVLWPDVPERKIKGASIPVCAALLSDIHVGSKTFLDEPFERFTKWLKGDLGNPKQRELAGRVKYITIAGDLVDGIGVYPNQEAELSIRDIYGQYESFAKLIERIPDYIEIIVIPGNHDAVRQAMPQPALSRKYFEPIMEAREVISLGNPARIEIHGVNLLLYHGRSLEDVIGMVPYMSYQTPEKAMEHLLRARHLAPVYGKKTLISAEMKDHLIIDDPPDVFQSGHVHVMKSEVYRGVNIVNCGAWQNQTEFQRKMGLVPTPGILPILDLQKLQLTSIDFTKS
jgi:DNA polymerase II small subunit